MYIYVNLLNLRATCGSVEQPLLGPSGKALNQPTPNPTTEQQGQVNEGGTGVK